MGGVKIVQTFCLFYSCTQPYNICFLNDETMLVEYCIIISCDVFFKVHAIVTDQRRRYSACYVHTASEQAKG